MFVVLLCPLSDYAEVMYSATDVRPPSKSCLRLFIFEKRNNRDDDAGAIRALVVNTVSYTYYRSEILRAGCQFAVSVPPCTP